jgi:hypothetical protein
MSRSYQMANGNKVNDPIERSEGGNLDVIVRLSNNVKYCSWKAACDAVNKLKQKAVSTNKLRYQGFSTTTVSVRTRRTVDYSE